MTLWFLFISRRATLPLPSPGSPLRLFQVGIVSLQIGHESAKRLAPHAPNASGCSDDYLPCHVRKHVNHNIVMVNYNIVHLSTLQHCNWQAIVNYNMVMVNHNIMYLSITKLSCHTAIVNYYIVMVNYNIEHWSITTLSCHKAIVNYNDALVNYNIEHWSITTLSCHNAIIKLNIVLVNCNLTECKCHMSFTTYQLQHGAYRYTPSIASL